MDEARTPENERDTLAAELALGLLTSQERADALRLSLRDPGFAQLVRAWEDRLAPMHSRWGDDETAPPDAAVWRGIEAQIAAPRTVVPLQRQLRRWQAGAFGSGALAASLALALVWQPAQVAMSGADPQRVTVARIEGTADGPLVLARYDAASGELRLRMDGFAKGELAPELWAIPADGTPRSLGQIGRTGDAAMTMSMPHRSLMQAGTTLAITMEPVSPTPHAAPTSAPVATGKITII